MMNRRLFFLKHDGWFEVEVTGRLLHASQEELLQLAYAMMEQYHYRNYLITDDPERMLVKKESFKPTG